MIDPHTWIAIRKKQVLADVFSPEIYEQRSLAGLKKAAGKLLEKRRITPSIPLLKAVHKDIFSEITPWAGKPTSTQLITHGFVTCDPKKIEAEGELLEEQWRNGFRQDANPTEKTRWIAFAAARFLRIHPFPDGNKRAIALWTICICHREFGNAIQNKKQQWEKLHRAFTPLRTGNLQPFGELLLETWGKLPEHPDLDWTNPHKIAPAQIEPKEWIQSI